MKKNSTIAIRDYLEQNVIRTLEANLSAPGIYSIKNKKNGEYYVGQSINIIKRLVDHCNNANHGNDVDAKSIDKAIARLGIDSFEFKIEFYLQPVSVSDFETLKESLNQLENQTITRYDSKNHGYNKTCGNHKGKYTNEYTEYIKEYHPVTFELFKQVKKVYNNFDDKNILLINHFNSDIIKLLKTWYNCITMISNSVVSNDEILGKFIVNELERLGMGIKDFDVIISNPPYGKIGAEITNKINQMRRDDSKFINIMPANDYLRVPELWKYVIIESRENADFYEQKIAAVTSDVVELTKCSRNYMDKDSFEIEMWRYNGKDIYKKYLYETRRRHNYAIDDTWSQPSIKTVESLNVTTDNSFIIHFRTPNHLAHGSNFGTKETSVEYRWNVKRDINKQYILDNHCNNGAHSTFGFIKFNTAAERDNFTNFILGDGLKFFKRICKIANPDSSIIYGKIMPKVDWRKAWTLEEILKDYGYSDEEIQEILDDLN